LGWWRPFEKNSSRLIESAAPCRRSTKRHSNGLRQSGVTGRAARLPIPNRHRRQWQCVEWVFLEDAHCRKCCVQGTHSQACARRHASFTARVLVLTTPLSTTSPRPLLTTTTTTTTFSDHYHWPPPPPPPPSPRPAPQPPPQPYPLLTTITSTTDHQPYLPTACLPRSKKDARSGGTTDSFRGSTTFQ
jgi:hypothetical protein